MVEPWGALGLLLFVVGLANAMRPEAVWRLRQGTMTRRGRDLLTGSDGRMIDFQRRLERWCGLAAAIAGLVVVAVVAH